MSTNFEDVINWHRVFRLPVGTSDFNDIEYRRRRARLIAEEFCETISALGFQVKVGVHELGMCPVFGEHLAAKLDPVAFLDGLGDLGFVIEGSACELGWGYDEARKRIYRSNMSKADREGNPILDENGKVQKGPDFRPPYLEDLVNG